MSSLFGIYDIGNSALQASQAGLSTTSNNIANANTPGYSNEELVLQPSSPAVIMNGSFGTGVTVEGVTRDYSQFIQSQLVGQQQNVGADTALSQSLSQVEQVFNDAQGAGLSTSLTNYFNAWQNVVTDPQDQTQRTALLQSATSLVSTAQQMGSGLTATIQNINSSIGGTVNQINSIASNIASLNGQIAQADASPVSTAPNELEDQRDSLVSQLSNLMQISTYQNQNGSITITAGMRNLVNGTQTNTLSTQLNANGDEDLSLDGVDITGSITTGQLGGDIAARNTIESGSLLDLSKLVASLTVQTNSLQSSGYGLDGSTGNNFFTPLQLSTQASSANATITANITDPSQLTLDGYNISFDATASNYTVTDEQTGAVAAAGAYTSGSPIVFDGIQVTITGPVAPTDTFSVSPLTNAIQNFGVAITDPNQIAAASSNTALPGDNTNATAIANLAQSSISTLGNSTFSDYYNGLVAQVGTQSAAASNSLTFDNNLLTQIQTNQQSVSGVNLDDEATNLLQYERSYEASAQIIKVTDELVQTVIGMVSAV